MEVRPSYEQAVEQAADALKKGEQANWDLARYTYENTIGNGEVGRGQQSRDGRVSMAAWCRDIRAASGRRFSDFTGGVYRRAWERRQEGLARGQDLSWAEAYESARGDNDNDDLLAGRQERLADKYADDVLKRGTPASKTRVLDGLSTDQDIDPQQKIAAAAQLLAAPDVQQHLAVGGKTIGKLNGVYDALSTAEERAKDVREAQLPPSLRESAAKGYSRMLDLSGVLDRAAKDIKAAVKDLPPIRADEQFWLADSIQRVEEALEEVRAYHRGEPSPLDAFLKDTLKQ